MTRAAITGHPNPGSVWVTLKYHQDPGHGWVETTRAELLRLGLADQISTYSYVLGDPSDADATVYLEEDCDAPKLTAALEAEGRKVRLCPLAVEFDHPIRCLPRFVARTSILYPQAA